MLIFLFTIFIILLLLLSKFSYYLVSIRNLVKISSKVLAIFLKLAVPSPESNSNVSTVAKRFCITFLTEGYNTSFLISLHH